MSKDILCTFCNRKRKFTHLKNLWDHIRHFPDHYKCLDCDTKYDSFTELEVHCHEAHNLCCECYSTFESAKELTEHVRFRHPQARTIVCPGKQCFKRFKSGGGLLSHLESGRCSSGMDRERVNQLAIELDTNNIVTNPARLLRGPDGVGMPKRKVTTLATELSFNGSKYECFLCHAMFATLANLNKHLAGPVHSDKIYRCPKTWDGCGHEFATLSGLCQHVESGAGKCKIRRFNAPVQEAIATMTSTLKGLVL